MPICTFYESNQPFCIDLRNQLNGIIQQYVEAHKVSEFDEALAKCGIKKLEQKTQPIYCNGHALILMTEHSDTAVDNIVYVLADAQSGLLVSRHEHAGEYHKDMFIITYFNPDAILC